jgi:hypothetical protein
MALLAPLLTGNSAIRFSLEATKGTAVLGAADLYVEELETKLTAPFVEKNGAGGSLGQIVAGAIGEGSGTCNFRTPLKGNAASGLDASLAILFQACGLKQTVQVYNVHSAFTDQKTISIDAYLDGVLMTLSGAMGNLKFEGVAGNTIWCVFEFTGKWVAPTDVALIDPTYSVRPDMQLGSATFTFDTEAIKTDKLNIDMGNVVGLRKDVSATDGIASAIITDYLPKLEIDAEMDKIAGYDFYGKRAAGTLVAVSLVVTDGTDTLTFALPAVQIEEIAPSDREGVAVVDLICGIKHTEAGNDAVIITAT